MVSMCHKQFWDAKMWVSLPANASPPLHTRELGMYLCYGCSHRMTALIKHHQQRQISGDLHSHMPRAISHTACACAVPHPLVLPLPVRKCKLCLVMQPQSSSEAAWYVWLWWFDIRRCSLSTVYLEVSFAGSALQQKYPPPLLLLFAAACQCKVCWPPSWGMETSVSTLSLLLATFINYSSSKDYQQQHNTQGQ
jgi:hypothetical protein